jgi:hypothetical protein
MACLTSPPPRSLRPILLASTFLCLASCAGEVAYAQNKPVSGLAPRGTPVGTDQLPILPSGATSLGASYASDVQNYVLTSLNGFPGVDPTGVNDSTVGIQAALNTGQRLYCDGTYKTSTTLTLSAVANNGQLLVGTGATGPGGSYVTANHCTFKPAAGFAGFVFKIDGTPFGGYLTNWRFEDIAVDLTNVADTATNGAFNQIQAFDGRYDNVRVVNDGIYKQAWLFNAGAYTTVLNSVQGNILNFQGTGFGNSTTTITVINSDIGSFLHDYYSSVTFIGGAIQRGWSAAVPVQYLAPGVTPTGAATNTAGLYAAVLSQVIDSYNFTAIGTDFEWAGGFTGSAGCSSTQYNDGVHGCLTLVPVFEINSTGINNTLVNPQFAGMYLLDYSSSTSTTGANAGGGAPVDNFNVTAWFDQSILLNNGNSFYGSSGLATGTTFQLNASNGQSTFQKALVQPATDADLVVTWKNAAGSILMDFNSGGGINLENALALTGYSDVGATLSWQLQTPGGGNGTLRLKASGSDSIVLTGSNGSITSSSVNPSSSLLTNSKLLVAGQAPTITSGFSATAPTVTGSTTGAFLLTLSGTPSTSGVLGLPSAVTGWACTLSDRTTAATIRQTASTTGSATFALSGDAASDVLQGQCMGY